MDQERYWRNLIADEISAEHDRVMRYYRKKGMNNGGMSTEEHTRLNIFKLCESIVRTIHNSPDAPKEPMPKVTAPLHQAQQELQEINNFVEEQIADSKELPGQTTIDDAIKDDIRNLVKDRPQQDEFGQFF